MEVTDEEAAQRTFSYVTISTAAHTDEDSNTVEYTEEEKADLKKKAEDIASAEDFDTAVTDGGYTTSTASYGSAEDEDASFDKAVLEAADALKEGEVSPVIETESAYYVLRLDSEHDEEASASKKESLISEKEEAYYDDIVSGWKEKATWTINEKEWEKVTFEDRFAQIADDTESPSEEITNTEGTEEIIDAAEDTEAADGTEAAETK